MFRVSATSRIETMLRRRVLELALNRHFRKQRLPPRVQIVQASSEGSRHWVEIEKSHSRIRVGFDHRRWLGGFGAFATFYYRLPAVVLLFARAGASVSHAVADISDGDEAGLDMISFCARSDGAILVPDCDFYKDRGYAAVRSYAQAGTGAWKDRDDTIVWRGSTTGAGQIAPDGIHVGSAGLLPRTRLCLLLRDQPRTDVRFATVVQTPDSETMRERLEAASILGKPLDSLSWRERKFAIDIDGNSNAWSNLFTRLLLGCCVIKIGSKLGYRQWYYDDLRPWEHFVPVEPDMTDLIEKIEWCRTHQQECEEIAANGQQFATRRTYETEMQNAVERIERRLGSARG